MALLMARKDRPSGIWESRKQGAGSQEGGSQEAGSEDRVKDHRADFEGEFMLTKRRSQGPNFLLR